jgi:hypothetical protein
MLVLLEHGEVEILAIATGWITTAKKGCKSLGTEAMRTRVYLPSYGSHIHRASRHCFISMWCSNSMCVVCAVAAAAAAAAAPAASFSSFYASVFRCGRVVVIFERNTFFVSLHVGLWCVGFESLIFSICA